MSEPTCEMPIIDVGGRLWTLTFPSGRDAEWFAHLLAIGMCHERMDRGHACSCNPWPRDKPGSWRRYRSPLIS